MEKITLRKPDDFHVHFRRMPMLYQVAPHTAMQFARALVMPNTTPSPVLTAQDVTEYRSQILEQLRGWKTGFEPLMTIQITDATTSETVRGAKAAGAIAGKIYPKGVTTNSHNGVSDFRRLTPVLSEMQKAGMVACIHGQQPEAFCLDREREFLETLQWIVKTFPRLRIVMEHLSTAAAVKVVERMPPRVGATITLHHLVLTLHEVISWHDGTKEGFNPHHYCQPIPQRPEDRAALVKAAISGNPKFFFGSDSAPHYQKNKEACCGAAGVFSAPVLLPMLVQLFLRLDSFNRLEPFISEFGARHYGLPLNKGKITLVQKNWKVPDEYYGVVSFQAGETLAWQLDA